MVFRCKRWKEFLKCCRLRGTWYWKHPVREVISSGLHQMSSQEVLVQLSGCVAGRYWELELWRELENTDLWGMVAYSTCFSPCSWKFASDKYKPELSWFHFWRVKYSPLRSQLAFMKLCGVAFLDFRHSPVHLKSSEYCLSQWMVPWLHWSMVNVAKQVNYLFMHTWLFQQSFSCVSLEHHAACKPLDWALLIKTFNGIHHQCVGMR